MTFKIGDKVKRINNDWEHKDRVVEVTNNSDGWLRFKEVPQPWNTDNFELVTESTMKFKVGDKVRRKPEHMDGFDHLYDIHTIIKIKEGNGYLWLDQRAEGWWHPEKFDLVTEPMKFKIGDKVRWKPDQQDAHWARGDKEFTIEEVDESFIYFKEFTGSWYPWRFELVEEPPTKEVPFSIGDIVKLKDTTHYDGTYKVQAIDDYTESVKVEGVNVWFHAGELEIAPIPVKTKEDELREFLENWRNCSSITTPQTQYSQGFRDGANWCIEQALSILNKN